MITMPDIIMMIEDDNDRVYVQQMFLKNERAMYVMALRIVKNHHTACDIVSAACLTMMEKVEYLKNINDNKQTPYILSIVKNTALLHLRKRKRENNWLVDDDRVFDYATYAHREIDEALIADAEMRSLTDALQRISKKERELLQMKYFEQMSDDDIGKTMGIGKDSVRYYLTKARRSLKKELKKDDTYE